jgi:hypothetical protein
MTEVSFGRGNWMVMRRKLERMDWEAIASLAWKDLVKSHQNLELRSVISATSQIELR